MNVGGILEREASTIRKRDEKKIVIEKHTGMFISKLSSIRKFEVS
jgi:hypothetical protein